MADADTFDDASIEELVKLATDPSFDAPEAGVLQQGVPGLPEGGPVLQSQFQQGGVVDAQPQQAGVNPAGNNTPIPSQQMQAEAQRIIREHPQEFLQVKNLVQQAVQAGEVTMEELNLAGQLATAAAQNPQLWPQLRNFAVQRGLAEEQDLPQQYDQGLVFTLILAIQAIQGQPGSPGAVPQAQGQPPQPVGAAPQAQGQAPRAGLKAGGEVPSSRNRDGSVAITAHDGEFVIPAHVVRKKGTDFFEKMIEKDDGGKSA